MKTRNLNTNIQRRQPLRNGRRVIGNGRNFNTHISFSIKKYLRFFLSFFLVGVIYLSWSSYSRVKSYNQNIDSGLTQLEGKCKLFDQSSNLTSILNLNFDINNKLTKAIYTVYDSETTVQYDMSNYQFNIDKGMTSGTLGDYFLRNNVFLNQNQILQNIHNLFLKEFYLNVDYLVIGNEDFNLSSYISSKNTAFLNKVVNSNSDQNYKKISTNVCLGQWDAFAENLFSAKRKVTKVNYDKKQKLTDYFFFSSIKKEQIRIYIDNRTGVENWGIFLEKLFTNYGLKVVKIDSDNQTTINSSIYIDSTNLNSSNTLKQIKSLLGNETIETNVKDTIFADIYLEVGQDLLIQ